MKHLITSKDLHTASLGTLGKLTSMTYDQATAAANTIASRRGVANPRLIIHIQFKPGANEYDLAEHVYAVGPFE